MLVFYLFFFLEFLDLFVTKLSFNTTVVSMTSQLCQKCNFCRILTENDETRDWFDCVEK